MKKLLSLILAIIMVLGMFPVAIFAEETENTNVIDKVIEVPANDEEENEVLEEPSEEVKEPSKEVKEPSKEEEEPYEEDNSNSLPAMNGTEYVATIQSGDAAGSYETIQAAIDEVSNGSAATIYLLKDTKENFSVPINKTVVLDLHCKTLTLDASVSSTENGLIENEGNLQIINGEIIGNYEGAENTIAISNEGSLTISDVDISLEGGVNTTSIVGIKHKYVLTYTSIDISYVNLTMTGSSGELVGFETEKSISLNDRFSVSVTGATKNVALCSSNNSILTVYGGKYVGSLESGNYGINIFGGKFSEKPSANYLQPFCEVEALPDSAPYYWQVVKYVARTLNPDGETYQDYSIIQEALDKAPTDGSAYTIELVNNATESLIIKENTKVILEMGTYKISGVDKDKDYVIQNNGSLSIKSGTIGVTSKTATGTYTGIVNTATATELNLFEAKVQVMLYANNTEAYGIKVSGSTKVSLKTSEVTASGMKGSTSMLVSGGNVNLTDCDIFTINGSDYKKAFDISGGKVYVLESDNRGNISVSGGTLEITSGRFTEQKSVVEKYLGEKSVAQTISEEGYITGVGVMYAEVTTEGGDKKIYFSLQNAINDCKDNTATEIKIINDVYIIGTLLVGEKKVITIDLNGYMINGEGITFKDAHEANNFSVIKNDGDLTITDKSNSKTVRYFTNEKCVHNIKIGEKCGLCEERDPENSVAVKDESFETYHDSSFDITGKKEGVDYVKTEGSVIAAGQGCNIDTDYTKVFAGGGVCNHGVLKVTNITFCGGSTQNHGGAFFNNGTATITDCKFVGNYSENGGAIVNKENSGNSEKYPGILTIKGNKTLFKYNSASADGGVIYNAKDTVINGTATFSNNSAENFGGAIFTEGNLTIDGKITFTENNSDNGGAIYVDGNTLIKGCTFEKNTAEIGGAIGKGTDSYVTISDTTIKNNSATNIGGAFGFASTTGCLAKGTEITMADGSIKKIENIEVGDFVKVFDHHAGKYMGREVFFAYESPTKKSSFTLNFEDGNSVSFIAMHDLFEQESMKYVAIGESEAESFIGKHFYNAESGKFVELVSVTHNNDSEIYYSIYTKYSFNCIANGMLNVADDTDFYLNIFEFNEDLTVNKEALQRDIEKYGIFEYDESLFTREEYDYCQAKYSNIVMGKGLRTYEELLGYNNERKDYYGTEDTKISAKKVKAESGALTCSTYIDSDKYGIIVIIKNVTITDNKVNGKENNVCLGSNTSTLIGVIDGATNVKIGVNLSHDNGTGPVTVKDSTDWQNYFFSDEDLGIYNHGAGNNQQVYIGTPAVEILNGENKGLYANLQEALDLCPSGIEKAPETAVKIKVLKNLSESVMVNEKTNVELDLNGKVIDGSNSYTNAIIIDCKAVLTLVDGNSTAEHHFSENNCLWVWDSEEKETAHIVKGGVITGSNTSDGAGIYVYPGATLNMSKGNIVGNYAYSNGGGIYCDGTLNITGGLVSGNIATNGGGVALTSNGNITVGGSALIRNNLNVNCNAQSNLYLPSGKTATVSTENAPSTMKIGVTLAGTTGVFTAKADNNYENYFISDNPNYSISTVSTGANRQTQISTETAQILNGPNAGLYDSLQLALNAVEAGTTEAPATATKIKLLKDTKESVKTKEKTNVEIDLNEKTITNTGYHTVDNLSVLSIKNGKVVYTSENKSLHTAIYISNKATSTSISDIEVEANAAETITIGIHNDGDAALTIKDIKITASGKTVYGISSKNDVTLGDGIEVNVTGTTEGNALNIYGSSSKKMTVTGGKYVGKLLTEDDAVLEISGGYFSEKPDNDYLKTGYCVTDNVEEATKTVYPYMVVKMKQLTVSGTTVNDKTYDGKVATTATVGTVSGIEKGDTVTVSVKSAVFEDKNVGEGKKVTVTYEVTGTNAAKYYAPVTDDTFKAKITKKELTVTGTVAETKTYDGNTTATISTKGTLQSVQSDEQGTADTVSINTATGTFENKDNGTNKKVTVVYTLTGTDAGNYTVANSEIKANINKVKLTVTQVTFFGKTYDGTVNATVKINKVKGIVGEEKVEVSVDSATFKDKNVGKGKDITAVYAISGDDAGNYLKPDNDFGHGEIKQKQLTVSGTVVSDKEYDAKVAATATIGTVSGICKGDTVTASVKSAVFENKNVGEGKKVTVVYELSGTDAGNYIAPVTDDTFKAKITKKELTVTGTVAETKTYDGNTTATISTKGTLQSVQSNEQGTADTVSINTATGTFENKDNGTNKKVTVVYTLTGTDAGNYTVANSEVKADINKKQLTVTQVTFFGKTYDGTVNATVKINKVKGIVGEEKVEVSVDSATFKDKNVGKGKDITAVYAISGDDAGNYLKPDNDFGHGEIKQKQLTVSGTVVSDKEYDAKVAATTTIGTVSGICKDDTVTASVKSAVFENKNVGEGKKVTVVYELSGTDAGNYIAPVTDDTFKAKITKKELTVTGTVAETKTYDGNTTATISTKGTLQSVQSNEQGTADTVSINTATGTFENKDNGTNKKVTVVYTLTGTDAGNYTVANSEIKANINKVQLTISTESGKTTTVKDKDIDGKTTAEATVGTVVGVVGTEDVKVEIASANFDSKDVGENKTVTVKYKISGADSGNYNKPVDDDSFKAKISIKVSFEYKGSSPEGPNDADRIYEYKAYTPYTPEYVEDYIFLGWYKDEDCTEEWDNTAVLNDNVTIYGKWEEDFAVLNFNIKGGKKAPAEQGMRYTESAFIPETKPYRNGYTFIGWSTNPKATYAEYQPGDLYKPTKTSPKDATLYAVWREKNYIIIDGEDARENEYNPNTGAPVLF